MSSGKLLKMLSYPVCNARPWSSARISMLDVSEMIKISLVNHLSHACQSQGNRGLLITWQTRQEKRKHLSSSDCVPLSLGFTRLWAFVLLLTCFAPLSSSLRTSSSNWQTFGYDLQLHARFVPGSSYTCIITSVTVPHRPSASYIQPVAFVSHRHFVGFSAQVQCGKKAIQALYFSAVSLWVLHANVPFLALKVSPKWWFVI